MTDLQKLQALTDSLLYTIKEQGRTMGYLNEILRITQEQLNDCQEQLEEAQAQIRELTVLTNSLLREGAK